MDIHREIGNRSGEANALGNLGIVYIELGDYESALKYLIQGMIILQAIGSPDVSVIANILSKLREEVGEDRFRELLDKVQKELGVEVSFEPQEDLSEDS